MDIEFDVLVPNFRQAKERWTEAPTLVSHYESLVESYASNNFALIETIKSYIECVCHTILGEFGKSMTKSDPSTSDMLLEALDCLGFQNSRGPSKLSKVLSAYKRLADALSEMRNENGPVAHGKDGFLDNLTNNHMRAFLFTGDTLIGLLLSALEGKEPDLKFTREPYERFSHFHDRIDYSVAVETTIEDEEDLPIIVVKMKTARQSDDIVLRIEPSRLLYCIDRTVYAQLLSAAEIKQPEIIEPEEVVVELEETYVTEVIQTTSPTVQIEDSYVGALLPWKAEFERYIESLGISAVLTAPDGKSIIDSLLATAESNMGLDWTEREILQARMKIALRRVLVKFGVESNIATESAEHLMTWLKKQSAEIESLKEDG